MDEGGDKSLRGENKRREEGYKGRYDREEIIDGGRELVKGEREREREKMLDLEEGGLRGRKTDLEEEEGVRDLSKRG